MPESPRFVAHPPPEGVGTPHLPHLDSLRGIAALLVVLHHARLEARPAGPAVHQAFAWLAEGHFCVTFFVLLSGYCLTLPTLATDRLKGGFWGFMARRARRLLPAYYVALLGSIALVATVIGQPTFRHWDFALPLSWRAVWTHVLMIHNVQIATILKINHVFWSIAVEWQLYFSLPLLLWLKRGLGPWAAVAIALMAGYAGYARVGGTDQFGLMPHYYGVFALGMLAASLARTAVRPFHAGLVAAVAAAAWLGVYRRTTYELLDLPFSIAGAACLVLLHRPGRIRSALGWRPLVALGGFSYSLYLVHAPLQHLVVVRVFLPLGLPPEFEFPALALAATPPILLASYLFSLAFERPFLAKKAAAPSAAIAGPTREISARSPLASGPAGDHNR